MRSLADDPVWIKSPLHVGVSLIKSTLKALPHSQYQSTSPDIKHPKHPKLWPHWHWHQPVVSRERSCQQFDDLKLQHKKLGTRVTRGDDSSRDTSGLRLSHYWSALQFGCFTPSKTSRARRACSSSTKFTKAYPNIA